MNRNNTCVLVLAAGKGTRMNSSTPKPLQKILETPALDFILDVVQGLETFVVSSEEIENYLLSSNKKVSIIKQDNDGYGTGYAVLSSLKYIKSFKRVLIIQADDPLIEKDDINLLMNDDKNKVLYLNYEERYKNCSELVVKKGLLKEIKGKSCDKSKFINIGRYILNIDDLIDAGKEYLKSYKEGEYSLPDIINIMIKRGRKVFAEKSISSFLNMNTRKELYEVNRLMQERINLRHISNGVLLSSLESIIIGKDVEIASDTKIIGPTQIYGKTTIGKKCIINSSYIENSMIEEETSILFSVINNAIINDRVIIGPFAHLRPQSYIGAKSVIGNFVEIKNANIGNACKARHLSYLGDVDIGTGSNIGCGSITANYDGKNKHHTGIGSNCFIGCNSTLVAPIVIEDNCFIAAGSTITEDVKSESLAIGRARQVNKEHRAKDYLKKE